jgi:hypothetical protein
MPAGPIGEAKRSPSRWGQWPHLGTDRSDTRSPARPVAAGREQIARNIERFRRMPAGPIGEVKQSPSRVGPVAPPWNRSLGYPITRSPRCGGTGTNRSEHRALHIPVENEHLFRFKMNADSGLRVHRFRTPQCTYSDVR